ncbi:unnamed protein product [Vitrella brassicaformis CCMP3155]|uniref:DAGKc domain-containing protein n=1 Tax=Vitrella brassicaformis (strain CCMP3155) TaxID=1169540 RepID=A0A0G4FEK6_VITBC|nr:unnamed protein product [Vitrella brassicaformis CCMP3155]|eukprot:CEM11670.1 unnamed protein product [Vitrella brassicaformis CCMP3155]
MVIIANPTAGAGRGREVTERLVLPTLQTLPCACIEVLYTTCLGSGVQLTRRLFEPSHAQLAIRTPDPSEAASAECLTIPLLPPGDHRADVSAVVVVGGDGTMQEVIGGLMSVFDCSAIPSSDVLRVPPVGIVPMGTANSLASDFLFAPQAPMSVGGRNKERALWSKGLSGMEDVVRWAVNRIVQGVAVPIDLLECDGGGEGRADGKVWGSNGVYLGMLLDVNLVAERLRWIGPKRFDVAGLWCIMQRPAYLFRMKYVTPEGEKRERTELLHLLSVDKVQHWTDNKRVAFNTQLDNGIAQVLCVKALLPRRQLLTLMLQAKDFE